MKRSSKGNEAVFKYNKIPSLSIKNYFGLVESEWKKRYYDPERLFKGKYYTHKTNFSINVARETNFFRRTNDLLQLVSS